MKLYVSKWWMVTRYIRCYDFYKVLPNIPKTVLARKYIVLFISLFVLLQKEMCRIIYLQGKRLFPTLDIMIIHIQIL